MPRDAPNSMASRRDCSNGPPPHEFEETCAPILAAYIVAAPASAVVPAPCAFRNLSAMILTFQFTPATPTPFEPTAPIVPATCVPCLWSSNGLLSPFTQSQPRQSST